MKLLEYSFAKINVFLDILSLRQDGYHNIRSVMVPIDWYDTLSLESRKDDKEEFWSTDSELMAIPLEDLTIGCAIDKMRPHRKNSLGFSLQLIKHVPYKAGLGISSSNAVSVLKLLNEHWDCGLTESQLEKISREIESDCSFFFSQEVCEVTGRGEQVQHLGKKPNRYPLGIFKRKENGISTEWAYRQVRESQYYNRYPTQGEHLVDAWNEGVTWTDLSFCRNGFFDLLREICPSLRETYDFLKAPENIVQMNGSGSSFSVFFQKKSDLESFLLPRRRELENNFDFYFTIL